MNEYELKLQAVQKRLADQFMDGAEATEYGDGAEAYVIFNDKRLDDLEYAAFSLLRAQEWIAVSGAYWERNPPRYAWAAGAYYYPGETKAEALNRHD